MACKSSGLCTDEIGRFSEKKSPHQCLPSVPLENNGIKFCFVQYYHKFPPKLFSVDFFLKEHIFVISEWNRKDEVQNFLSASRSFRVIPVDSIRKKVHIV